MTDEEKRQYELARLGMARLMGDASEVDKWAKVVSQARAGEQRHAPTEAGGACICPISDTGTILFYDNDCPVHHLPPRLGG